MTKIIEGDFKVTSAGFAILAARFNGFVTAGLLSGAIDGLKRHGVSDDNIVVVRVPGAFEIPIAAQRLAKSNNYAAISALEMVSLLKNI